MKAALQVVRTAFGLVPLQRWLNGIGAALIAISVGVTILGTTPDRIGLILGASLFGMALILLVPGSCGGAMLRYGLSRSLMHLRPRGRARMLLGATLAITLMAVLAVVPITIAQLPMVRVVTKGLDLDGGLALLAFRSFVIAWNILAVLWIATFAITASWFATIFGWLFLLGLPVLGKFLERVVPDDLLPAGSTDLLLVTGPAAWILLVLWCLKARSIRPMAIPGWMVARSGDGPLDSATFGWAGRVDDTSSNVKAWQKPPARPFATRQYLHGPGSIAGIVGANAAVALFGLLMFGVVIPFTTSGGTAQAAPPWLKVPALYLPAYAFFAAALSGLAALRARHLWLRAGMDRARLFHLTEKYSLLMACLCLGGGAAVLLPLSLILRPDIAASMLMYGAVTCLFCLCMVYVGLSAQRYWSIAIWLGVLVLFLVRLPSIRPQPDASPAAALGAIALFALLAVALRWHARRRWSALDWHARRLPSMVRRTA